MINNSFVRMQFTTAVGLFALLITGSALQAQIVLPMGPAAGGSSGQIPIPSSYGGFNWPAGISWCVITNDLYEPGSNDTYGAPSGGGAEPGTGATGNITSNSPFTFEGADFASFDANDSIVSISATSITVSGFDAEGGLVGTASINLSASVYTFLSADIPNVTELTFTGSGGVTNSDWLMDNLTYTPASVPEPSTWAMLAFGVAGVGAIRRKRIKLQSAALLGVLTFFGAASVLKAQTIPTDGLVGFWSGNGNANDSSGYENNGVFSGSYVNGVTGEAFSVSPSTPFTAPDISAYNFTNGFSVSFWFYSDNPAATDALLGQDSGGGSNLKWFIDYNYENSDAFELVSFPPGTAVFNPSNQVSLTNAWHQLTLVADFSSYTFYLDGSFIGGRTDISIALPQIEAPLTFGYAENGLGYTGAIQDVALYDKALSAGEVQQLSTVPEPSSWAMMVAGVGALFAFRRRRR